jgi:vacuolar-type H+-ATPase subunit H
MSGQKTLLEQIREKESELNKQLELVTDKAESIVSDARRRSERIIGDAEAKGRELAAEHYRGGKAKIDLEVEAIKGREAKEAQALRESGEKNLPSAVELIIKAVTFR